MPSATIDSSVKHLSTHPQTNSQIQSTMTTAPADQQPQSLASLTPKEVEEVVASLDMSDLEEKFTVSLDSSWDSFVVIDNLPKVDAVKEEKLVAVIKKIFRQVGSIKSYEMPRDPAAKDGLSKGFMFAEFETSDQAQNAIITGNGFKLDKSHSLAVNKLEDIPNFAVTDAEYKEPAYTEFLAKEDLKYWLVEPLARDQFAVMKGDDVAVYYNNKSDAPDVIEKRQNWAELYINWSPKGTYLATVYKPGVALWAGPSWQKINRFPHLNVKHIHISPNEKYLVTCSTTPFKGPLGENHHVIVWDIVSGRQLRTFPLEKNNMEWPVFKWSHDDQYLAKGVYGAQGSISIYETPGMGLLEKKSVKVENLMAFEWCPTKHIISYWTPEVGNIPARVCLLAIPSRSIVRSKNLFNLIDAKLYWQSNGDYLLVRVDRAKTKKSVVTNFEIFRMNERDIPVDVMECKPTEEITGIWWEPKGTHFVVLSNEGQKIISSFYQMMPPAELSKSANDVRLIRSGESKGVNQAFWSPKGRFCVLAGIQGHQGDLQFWDVEDGTLLNFADHYMCTGIEWDPTGRYVVSLISWWQVQIDTGFTMWTMAGQMITKQPVPQFKQFLWRPRPESLLSEEEMKKVKKAYKEYAKEFEESDAAFSNKAARELMFKRRALCQEWKEYKARSAAAYAEQAPVRTTVYGFDPSKATGVAAAGGEEYVEEWIEEVVEEREEIVE